VTFALSLLRLVDRLYPEQLLLLLITCGCAIPVALTLLLAHAAHTILKRTPQRSQAGSPQRIVSGLPAAVLPLGSIHLTAFKITKSGVRWSGGAATTRAAVTLSNAESVLIESRDHTLYRVLTLLV
jgi:hypothetical protein